MNVECTRFRERLAQLLSGRGDARAVGELSWHEHLLGCGDCRALLETEQALEQLLASLPRPQLPPELAARVLARLEPHRGSEAALDRLLELPTADVPIGLAGGLLARLAAARAESREEHALDRLLECVPAPVVPADLRAKVLTGLRFERERVRPAPAQPVAKPARTVAARRPSRTRTLALAAGFAVALGVAAWWFVAREGSQSRQFANASVRPIETTSGATTTNANEEPPAELLATLDLLESWELVTSEDIDVQLNALDSVDELLLSSGTDASSEETNPAGEGSPKKG